MPKKRRTTKTRRLNRKKYLILVIILAVASGIYLNRAYAHIYGAIGGANLRPVNGEKTYIMTDVYLLEGFDLLNGVMAINETDNTLIYTALGDSLTAGAGTVRDKEILPYLLAGKIFAKDKQIILQNRAVPGAKTADVIANFLPAAIGDNPDIITLLIGVNDIHDKVSAGEFQKNYEEILSRLKNETSAEIYVINLPFIGADSLMLPPYQSLFDARTREFNKIIKKLADKYSVKYINLYSPTVDLFKHSGNHYSSDLFHPSAFGYQLWADIIYDSINK